jgi:hypothetical protein
MRARDNPFRVDCIQQIPFQFESASFAELLQTVERSDWRGAIVGPHGSGKTTLLEHLEQYIRARGFTSHWIRLNSERRSLGLACPGSLRAGLMKKDFVFFDGAEQLHRIAWLWFQWSCRKAGGLIITTHEAGRLPTLIQCRTSPALLGRIAAHLLGVSESEMGEISRTLFEKHRGNLRNALRDFYELSAQLSSPPIPPR